MAEKAIEKGLRYYDPKNKSIVYVVRNGMASGKDLYLAVEPTSGLFKTTFTGSKSLPKRYVPIN